MTTATLKYNSRNIEAKKTLDSIFSLGLFKIKTLFKRKSGIERALEDVRKGRVYTAESAESLIAQCLQ